jgi:hypothetical protein
MTIPGELNGFARDAAAGPSDEPSAPLPSFPCEREHVPAVVAVDEDEDDDLEEIPVEELPAALEPVDDFEEDDFDDDFDDDFEEELEEDDLDEAVTEADLKGDEEADGDDVELDDE